MKPHKCPVCEGTGGRNYDCGADQMFIECHGCNGDGYLWEPKDSSHVCTLEDEPRRDCTCQVCLYTVKRLEEKNNDLRIELAAAKNEIERLKVQDWTELCHNLHTEAMEENKELREIINEICTVFGGSIRLIGGTGYTEDHPLTPRILKFLDTQ